jgi:uncharacterized damage-inducible protein DinB
MDTAWIDSLERDTPKLRKSVAGLTVEQLNATPVPGTWSIQQIVVHLLDTELVFADRIKRVIAHDNPPLAAFDESRYVATLHYELWTMDDALTMFELNRKNLAKLVRVLPEETFERGGLHSEMGQMRLGQMIPRMVEHFTHHLKFIHQKRALLEQGK